MKTTIIILFLTLPLLASAQIIPNDTTIFKKQHLQLMMGGHTELKKLPDGRTFYLVANGVVYYTNPPQYGLDTVWVDRVPVGLIDLIAPIHTNPVLPLQVDTTERRDTIPVWYKDVIVSIISAPRTYFIETWHPGFVVYPNQYFTIKKKKVTNTVIYSIARK